jgi:saccharopine dehydrogenase-like protein
MSEGIPASGTVHWLGTGLSTGSGLRVLTDTAEQVVVWARTEAKAEALLARLDLTGQASVAEFSLPALEQALRPGDVVVSMLPAAQHPDVLRTCVSGGAHFACTSYVSASIAALVPAAAEAGTVVLTEAGLDPGIDHLLAHQLVAQARAAIGDGPAEVDFTSYCGGIPAVPNAFRYRFSWAPRGVLSALREPATYIEDGERRQVSRPWEVTRPHTVDGNDFEVYPNRDSIPFIDQYAIPDGWQLRTFVRGTLRLDGWKQAWAGVFAELITADDKHLDSLAKELAAEYPSTEADADRVVLVVGIDARSADQSWAGRYELDLTGDAKETAMARCVSLPLAFGITRILDGQLAPGLHRAAEEPAEVQRWLSFLRDHGIDCVFRS